MSQQHDIVIKARKRQLLVIVIPALALMFQFVKSIRDEIGGSKSFSFEELSNLIFYSLFILACIAVIVYAMKKYSNKNPGLIISQMGIIDNSGIFSAGMVFWSDIVEINTSKIIFTDCIIIKVKNPKRYISNQKNVLKKMWLEMENRKVGSPINISVSALDYKFNDLFRIIQERYLSKHVESRTYELKKEKDVIMREKRELVDSINYAKRIQTAMLPSTAAIEKQLGENFILYLPKDIVSGDFYWIETIEDRVYFAACDCTGHGVPGALINIICTNALNRAIRESGLQNPAEILEKVSELIVESIGHDGEVKDGMDASLCVFNKTTRELFWAGANIPLWIARSGIVYELLEFKPDKQTLGIVENKRPFTNHKIEIQKDDILYMASDGFADQFGGENSKKLTRKKFKELILLQRNKSLFEQKQNLLKFHTEYKRQGDQIDDILVMGVRIEK